LWGSYLSGPVAQAAQRTIHNPSPASERAIPRWYAVLSDKTARFATTPLGCASP
jgi:hypothetical protein